MKRSLRFKSVLLIIMTLFFQVITFAQEATTQKQTRVKTTTTEWYVQPWAWIAGGAVFLLILVALLRRKGSSDKVTVTRTVQREGE